MTNKIASTLLLAVLCGAPLACSESKPKTPEPKKTSDAGGGAGTGSELPPADYPGSTMPESTPPLEGEQNPIDTGEETPEGETPEGETGTDTDTTTPQTDPGTNIITGGGGGMISTLFGLLQNPTQGIQSILTSLASVLSGQTSGGGAGALIGSLLGTTTPPPGQQPAPSPAPSPTPSPENTTSGANGQQIPPPGG